MDIDVRGGPRRFRGAPGGWFRPKIPGEPGRKSPAGLPSGTQFDVACVAPASTPDTEGTGLRPGWHLGFDHKLTGCQSDRADRPGRDQTHAKATGSSDWVPEGSLAGDLRPGFPWILGRSRPPGPPLDRRGPPRTSTCTKNQPRRPTLRPSGGERKIPPDRLQVPSQVQQRR